jgi:hypothetical protein
MYAGAIPLIRILVLQTFLVSISLPLFLVTVMEGYLTQIAAALVGLGVFVGAAFFLGSLGFQESSVAWGSVAGQGAFAVVCLLWIFAKTKTEDLTGTRPLF